MSEQANAHIEFTRNGEVIFWFPAMIKANGDLFMATKSAFEQFRRKHPTLSPSDAEISFIYDD